MRDLLEALQENLQGEYKLSSTQIYVPNDLSAEILNFTLSIPEEDLYTEEEGMGRELEVHITVKYGLMSESPEEVKEALKQYGKKEIEVELGDVSLFENPDEKYDVVKVDVISEDLHQLNALFSKLDNKDSHPQYTPHCTIAYVKKGLGKKYEGSQPFSNKDFSVNNFYFCSSTGNKFKIGL